jgi:hypothetical protein
MGKPIFTIKVNNYTYSIRLIPGTTNQFEILATVHEKIGSNGLISWFCYDNDIIWHESDIKNYGNTFFSLEARDKINRAMKLKAFW